VADPADCSFQFEPVGENKLDATSCDIAKAFLAKAGVSQVNRPAAPGSVAQIMVGDAVIAAVDPATVAGADKKGRDRRLPG
jgi:hypothetical protein